MLRETRRREECLLAKAERLATSFRALADALRAPEVIPGMIEQLEGCPSTESAMRLLEDRMKAGHVAAEADRRCQRFDS